MKHPGEIKLNEQLDVIKLAIAEDLKLVKLGNIEGLKILNLDEKIYKRIAELIKPTRSQKHDNPEEESDDLPKDTKKTKFTLPPGGNAFEHVVKDIKNGRTNI
jgi:hypothetical protein